MHKLPIVLIYSRLVIGLIVLLLSIVPLTPYKSLAVTLVTIGLLTDVFDGIIARRLNISTQTLRRLDSTVDQVFFGAVVVATYIQCPYFFRENALMIAVLVGVECLAYLISYLRFRKEIATHSIGAKLWTLLLFATLVQILLQCQSGLLFTFCFWVGLLTRLEIIAITVTLKRWTHDVPTFFHALKLRHGKAIKRHKLFNG